MTKATLSILIAGVFFLGGCAATVTEAGYYWGDYSTTLYKYTKEPGEETLNGHIAELEKIIQESKDRELKVPPGIYAELGYIKDQQGESGIALGHYANEMSLYPESKVFLERLTAGDNKGSEGS